MVLTGLRAVRSFSSMVLVGLWFSLGSLALRVGVYPAIWLWPRLRYRLNSRYFKMIGG